MLAVKHLLRTISNPHTWQLKKILRYALYDNDGDNSTSKIPIFARNQYGDRYNSSGLGKGL
ncbi:MAG: hypothetical protein JWP45_568 [Mucilaginibacter sp.]|nr:hypothetical protein [Mucilaginibacter sp.]